MEKKISKKQLIADLRLTAPLLKKRGNPTGEVPDRVLKAFRESLALHIPKPPMPGEQMIELALGLLDEQSRNAEDLLTGLRSNSVRCDEQDVARLVKTMLELAFIAEDIEASTSEPAYCLTELAAKIYGLTNPKPKITRLLQKLHRTD